MKLQQLPLISLVVAEFLSQVGNQIAAIAIPILVLQYTHSAIAMGMAGAATIAPMILAAFLGGQAIDRFGARQVSIIADLCSGLSVLLLPIVFIHFDQVSPIVIVLLVFIGALFDPTATSARQTLVPKLTKLARVPLNPVNGYRGSLENGADLLGPAIGAGLISLIGTVNTFFVNAVSFLICAAIVTIAVPRQRHPVLKHESMQPTIGVAFIWQHRQLRSLAFGGIALNFVLLPFLGLLLPILTTETFASPALLGLCLSLFGMAATLGALAYPTLTRYLSRSMVYYGGLLSTALSLLLAAVVETQLALLASVTLGGLLLGAGNPLEQTILQEVTPTRIAGQVFTAHTAISFTAGLFGLLLAGIATELTNIHWVLSFSSGLLAIAGTIAWYFMPLANRSGAGHR